jgi:hypothetical protein
MPGPRFSIARLMGIVVVVAVGLAAVRSPSETWAGAMLLLTCGILALGVVGAIAHRGTRRMWWLGFSLFGWGYLVLSGCGTDEPSAKLPTARLLEILGDWLEIPLHQRGVCFSGCMFPPGLDPYFAEIGHCLWALLAALMGGILAGSFLAPPNDRGEEAQPEAEETSHQGRGWRLPVTMTGLVVFILVGATAAGRSDIGAPLWAGLAFSLTCAFNGLLILGAIRGRGPQRTICLGAALFGAGYTALIFSRPAGPPPRTHLATDPILNGLRARLAPVAQGLFPPNARILEALDQPIPMQFPDETSLRDLLAHIKQATATPTSSGIPIYVDPVGLQEAERSLNSTVEIDLEGVPLRTTLRLCLKQLGLMYEVEHGYLRITSEDEHSSPVLDDPNLIVGHCLMALVAAGFGALAATLVAERRTRSIPSSART